MVYGWAVDESEGLVVIEIVIVIEIKSKSYESGSAFLNISKRVISLN